MSLTSTAGNKSNGVKNIAFIQGVLTSSSATNNNYNINHTHINQKVPQCHNGGLFGYFSYFGITVELWVIVNFV